MWVAPVNVRRECLPLNKMTGRRTLSSVNPVELDVVALVQSIEGAPMQVSRVEEKRQTVGSLNKAEPFFTLQTANDFADLIPKQLKIPAPGMRRRLPQVRASEFHHAPRSAFQGVL
jgi:hypothetical protein